MFRVSTLARRAFQAKNYARNFGAGPSHGHAAAGAHHGAHKEDSHGAHHDDHHHDDHHDDHHHHGPHVPAGYDLLGKLCLVTAYLWIFHRLKEDNGQLFGFYQPWLHPHEHDHFEIPQIDAEVLKSTRALNEEEHEDEEEHEEHDPSELSEDDILLLPFNDEEE